MENWVTLTKGLGVGMASIWVTREAQLCSQQLANAIVHKFTLTGMQTTFV